MRAPAPPSLEETVAYKADKRYYATKHGVLVREDHPLVDHLVVAKGREMPDKLARAYGLVDEDGMQIEPLHPDDPVPAPQAKEIKREQIEDKAVRGPYRRRR